MIFEFNPDDTSAMRELCKEYGDSEFPYSGKNENGESVVFEIYPDKIITTTYQSNDWIRTNCYCMDGTRIESFEKGIPLKEDKKICRHCGWYSPDERYKGVIGICDADGEGTSVNNSCDTFVSGSQTWLCGKEVEE